MSTLNNKTNNKTSFPTFFESVGMPFPSAFTSFKNEFDRQVKDFYAAFNKSEDSSSALTPAFTQARDQIEKYWNNLHSAFPVNSELTALGLQPFKDAFDKYLNTLSANFPLYSEFAHMFNLYPSINMIDEDKEYKIEAGVPGLDEKCIKVSIQNGTLTIKGEKETTSKSKDKKYVTREISYEAFERKITLPNNVDVDKAKATFKNGMLCITFPKDGVAHSQVHELHIEKLAN